MSRCSPKESRGPPASGSIKGLFFLYSPPPPPHCRSPVGLNAYCFSTREGESRAGLKCPACLFCTKLFSLEKLTEKKVPVINKLETVFPSTPRQHLSDRLLLLSATDKTYQKTQQSLIVFQGVFPERFSFARSPLCDVTKGSTSISSMVLINNKGMCLSPLKTKIRITCGNLNP